MGKIIKAMDLLEIEVRNLRYDGRCKSLVTYTHYQFNEFERK